MKAHSFDCGGSGVAVIHVGCEEDDFLYQGISKQVGGICRLGKTGAGAGVKASWQGKIRGYR